MRRARPRARSGRQLGLAYSRGSGANCARQQLCERGDQLLSGRARPRPPMTDTLRLEIKELIVASLRLTMSPAEIDDDVPLFGEGLGLDSVDALELVLELERHFSVAISDEEVGNRVLRSVSSIAEFIEGSRNGHGR